MDDARVLERRHHDDGQLRIARAQLDEPVETARPRHRQIEKNQVERALFLKCGARGIDRGGFRDVGVGEFVMNDELQRLDEKRMVVD